MLQSRKKCKTGRAEVAWLSRTGIINNKEPKASGEQGLRDVRIMRAIYEAARTGKTVKL